MRQIYNFDSVQPPPLSERMLAVELQRRKTRRQTALLALAGVMSVWCLIAAAFILYSVNVYLAAACMSYVIIAVCGAGVIAAVYMNNRRIYLCHSH